MSHRVVELQDLAGLDESPGPPKPGDIVATVRWGRAKLSLDEGTQNQPLVVILSRPLPFEVYIEFTASGAATEPDDYLLTFAEPPPGTIGGRYVRIPQGLTTGFVNLTIVDDGLVEGVELVDFLLAKYESTYLGADVRIIPEVNGHALRVAISDPPAAPPGSVFWSFETDTYAFDEDAPPSSTRVRINFSAPTPEPVQMRFYTVAGTAVGGLTLNTPGADFVNLDASGLIPKGATTFTVPLQIINDTTPEPAETFAVFGEVLTPGSLIVDGATTSTTITINASDLTPATLQARWASDPPLVTIVDNGLKIRLRILLSSVATQNLFIPVAVAVTSSPGDLQRIALQFPGGVYGTAVLPVGQTFTDIFVSVPNRLGIQDPMTFELTIGAASGVEPGAPSVLEVLALDQGAILPVVAFREAVQPAIAENSPTNRLIVIEVTNAAVADLTQPFSVELVYGGTATYVSDYRIFQLIGGVLVESPTTVNFAPNETTRIIQLDPVNDLDPEPTERYTVTLASPQGCTIGSPPMTEGPILNSTVTGGGQGLAPQFYFASEVLGRGPNVSALGEHKVNMIVDLGPGVSYGTDIFITMSAYSPNAVESLDGGLTGDYWFPDPSGKVLRIPAGQRYGALAFQATAAGVAGSQKRVVVEMASIEPSGASIDGYMQQTRWVAILCGAADDEGLAPPPDVPDVALDDYQVYANSIEDLTTIGIHGPITIPLPFNSAQAAVAAKYGPSGILQSYLAFVGPEHYWNGVAIAAHLAQVAWLDRNGGSFGTRRVYVDPTSGQEVHYIDPAVRWLDVGNPVYISVYEQSINGAASRAGRHTLEFAGDGSSYTQRKDAINWGRGIPMGVANQWHPSMTRDLYITARGHQHELYSLEFGESLKDTGPPAIIQSFVDNLHLTGFRFPTDPNNPGTTAQRPVLGRGPNRWLSKQRLRWGITYLHEIDWTSTNLAVTPSMQFHLRISNPGSWVITNCTATRSAESCFYVDYPGPIFIAAYNVAPSGLGRQHVKVVSRNPWRTLTPNQQNGGSSAGPSHGLLAVVENHTVGVLGIGDASDIEIDGHIGYIFCAGNEHRGDIGYNRRFYVVQANANNLEGPFIAESRIADLASQYIHGSPIGYTDEWFTTKYIEFDKVDIDIQGAGNWLNGAIALAGCWRVVFKPVTNASSIVAMNPTTHPPSGQAFFQFNTPTGVQPRYDLGAIAVDPLNRPIFGIGFTYPNPIPPGHPVATFRNRGGPFNASPGGVKFPSGFDAAGLPGAYCGSTRLADHWLWTLPDIRLGFNGLSPAQRDAYDGRDPGP